MVEKADQHRLGVSVWGLTDAYARLYAEQLTAKFSIQAIVDNKPGMGAIIAIDAVAKLPPDSYILLMTTSGTVWQKSGRTVCFTASCPTT
jgi:tripartite-type tricarboxylate transporter receptor subunit TctC